MRVLLVYPSDDFYAEAGYDRAWQTALEAEGVTVMQIGAVPDAWVADGPPDGCFDLAVTHVLNEDLVRMGPCARAAALVEAAGVPVVNPLSSLIAAADKLVCAGVWAAAGIPQPRTWALDGLAEWPGGELVVKSGWGDGAWEVGLASSLPDALAVAASWDASRAPLGPAVVQERVPEPDCIRLFATPERCSPAFEKARRAGALTTHGTTYPRVYEPDEELATLARRMVATLGGGLMGVDVLRAADGRLLALEANGPFGFDVTDPAQSRWVARAALSRAGVSLSSTR